MPALKLAIGEINPILWLIENALTILSIGDREIFREGLFSGEKWNPLSRAGLAGRRDNHLDAISILP